ncbi:hypothetical protein ABC337_12935 [Arthrobacter sp. 1P04PC]|uniref:hypothetical protein n=1 Tax=unclassified Arthrobacter TaxID=235627 RepID=UPI00399FDF32
MNSSFDAPLSAVDLTRFGRARWLPPYGEGNGLDALFWACLAELPHRMVPSALEALREEDIPGWAAPLKKPRVLPPVRAGEEPYQLWVATLRYNGGEDVLIRVLNDSR